MVQSSSPPRTEAAAGPAADRRRRQILGAASRLFRARGLHATGMREIAAELDMTAGNLYYYFPSKQELLAYCQEQTLDQLLALARRIRRTDEDAPGRLRRLIAGHVAVLNEATPGSLAHLEIDAVPAARRAPLLARRKSYEAAVRGLIEEGIARGELRAVDSHLAALALLGALNWTVKWFQPDGRMSATEVGEEFADLLLAGLLHPASSRQRRPREGNDSRRERRAERHRSRSRDAMERIPAGGRGGEASAAPSPAKSFPVKSKTTTPGATTSPAARGSAVRPGRALPGAGVARRAPRSAEATDAPPPSMDVLLSLS
jgi:AcrR family transcriptional regulator